VSESVELPIGGPEYAALGLIANPFKSYAPNRAASPGAGLIAHAAAMDLLTTLRTAEESGSSKPILIEKGAYVADYYSTAALAEALYVLTQSEELRILSAYIPMPAMRSGRVRASLGLLADRLTAPTLNLTIGKYAAVALSEFDASLPEASSLEQTDIDEYRAKFENDPAATADEVFGEVQQLREGGPSMDELMRDSGNRLGDLPTDPEETDTVQEDQGDIPMATRPEFVEQEEVAEAAATETPAMRVGEYLIAYAGVHFSPVIARALRAFRDFGTQSFAQELRITKAPKKTLKALCRFARFRYRQVVFIFDRFEPWESATPEIRTGIVATFAELRWSLDPDGTLVIMLKESEAPELHEHFAAATKLSWDMPLVARLEGGVLPIDDETVRALIAASSIGDDAQADALVEQVNAMLAEKKPEAPMEAAAAFIDDEALRAVGTSDASSGS
jgi:hypothetical protein